MSRILEHTDAVRSDSETGFDGQREMEMSLCLPQCAAGKEQARLAVAFISLK